MPLPPILPADRAHILAHAKDALASLSGSHLFITGGTGFYGKWLLESIVAANDDCGHDIRATLLSRNPAAFAAEVPHLAARPEFRWLQGATIDVSAYTLSGSRFDYLIDLATPSAAEVGAGGTALIERTLAGTAHLIEMALDSGVRRVLYASSGAANNLADTGYGELKRRSEAAWRASGIATIIARGYAFIGPYLPLSDKFAAGSFLQDALAGRTIRVTGNGSAVRSYLYSADLAVWLLTLLCRGRTSPIYDVGSDQAVSIAILAEEIAEAGGDMSVAFGQSPTREPSNTYVPNIELARGLGLDVLISRHEAIQRTLSWVQMRNRPTEQNS